jgi:hypothetical protein
MFSAKSDKLLGIVGPGVHRQGIRCVAFVDRSGETVVLNERNETIEGGMLVKRDSDDGALVVAGGGGGGGIRHGLRTVMPRNMVAVGGGEGHVSLWEVY